jgi:L-seryl-tRNA(Ser) seleniumtransferase
MPAFHVIPSIDELRKRPAIRALEAEFGVSATVDALRSAAADVRRALGKLATADTRLSQASVTERIEAATASGLRSAFERSLKPVINATGVIVHTNLGRAPLGSAAIESVAAIARGYSTLEYDLDRGSRSRRDVHAEALLCRLTGAEAAVVVNNNAAATLILLAALAAGREAIVSRGELVEIGGGFRIPDVMSASGAILREVGTTNKTRAADYGAAVNDRTGLLLRVHPSNFRIEGFTERPALEDLLAVGRRLSIPVAEDLGSGYLVGPADAASGRPPPAVGGVTDLEPSVEASIAAGVDVCCFSGDKLLGGPQAGIILGRRALVERIRMHPLMRALRVGKMTYAALEATLAEYAAGRAAATIPVRRMLTMTAGDIETRAKAVAAAINALGQCRCELLTGVSAVGGGSAPGVELPTLLVAVERRGLGPDAIDRQLRRGRPPVIGRIQHDRMVLDLRTVLPDQERALVAALESLQ